MASFNQVTLLGNITRDPEIKYLQGGTAVCELSLATNRVYKTESGEKRDEVTFVDITFFGNAAKVIGEYVKKGSQLFIQGRLKMDSWEDAPTGKRRQKLKVIGDKFQFLGGKSRDDQSGGTRQERGQEPDIEPSADDDIPF